MATISIKDIAALGYYSFADNETYLQDLSVDDELVKQVVGGETVTEQIFDDGTILVTASGCTDEGISYFASGSIDLDGNIMIYSQITGWCA